VFTALSREKGSAKAGASASRSLVSTAEGFVVPNALRQIDRLFDPTVTDTATANGALIAAVPWVRRLGRPSLNALGEPITSSPLDRFTTKATQDPLWTTLSAKGAWISKPEQGDLTDDEYYELVRARGAWLKPKLMELLPQIQGLEPEQAQTLVGRFSSVATQIARSRIAENR
jgi:hypothetical protein